MADPIDLIITSAGLDALVDAENGVAGPVEIVEIGLTSNAFDASPTLTALPGEFKRINAVSGQSVAANIIHMTAQDISAEIYDVHGIGLFLADGTLFAAFSQDDPIFSKVSIAIFLFAFDVRFSGDVANSIQFGDASFLYPPATEGTKGVAEIASQAETDGGADDERMVTPKKLAGALAPVLQSIADEATTRGDGDTALQNLIDALQAITVTGSGLATGGGDLTANRQIAVTEASDADVTGGTNSTKVLTPRRAKTLLPAGAVFAFAMNAAPAGYLECNGAAVSRATYAALFAAIGTTHGAGDGATTFNLPDLRGEFIRGWDDGRGVDPGRAFGSAQGDALKAHTHTVSGGTGGGAQLEAGSGGTSASVNTGSTGGTETRPRNVALLYAIKT